MKTVYRCKQAIHTSDFIYYFPGATVVVVVVVVVDDDVVVERRRIARQVLQQYWTGISSSLGNDGKICTPSSILKTGHSHRYCVIKILSYQKFEGIGDCLIGAESACVPRRTAENIFLIILRLFDGLSDSPVIYRLPYIDFNKLYSVLFCIQTIRLRKCEMGENDVSDCLLTSSSHPHSSSTCCLHLAQSVNRWGYSSHSCNYYFLPLIFKSLNNLWKLAKK